MQLSSLIFSVTRREELSAKRVCEISHDLYRDILSLARSQVEEEKNSEDKLCEIGEKAICLEAITKWSITENFGMMAEECGELLSAINKLLRGRASTSDVITELADVSLVITAFAMLLGYDKYLVEKERKLMRLKERLNM